MSPSSPPSDLEAALGHETDKQAWVDWLFSRVAARYDLGNDIMSLGWHTRWKERLVEYADVRPGMRVLDVACGTGDTTWMLAEKGADVIGTDINPDMMALAEAKRPPGAPDVPFVLADATALPFPDASFDLVTITYAGRGFPDWPAVLREAWRVLVPGGAVWNLDFARPRRRVVDRAYRGWMMGSGAVLGTVLHGHPKTYMYIPASMKHYPGQWWLQDRMREVGFRAHTIETVLGIMAYNCGVKPP